jgi:hypothetical protein
VGAGAGGLLASVSFQSQAEILRVPTAPRTQHSGLLGPRPLPLGPCPSALPLGTVREVALGVSATLFPQTPLRHRVFGGLTERQEHIFTWIMVVVVLLYATAWFAAIHDLVVQQREIVRQAREAGVKAPPPPPVVPTRQVTNAILDPAAPTNAYITDAMLNFLMPLRGESGKVFFTTRTGGAEVATGAPSGTHRRRGHRGVAYVHRSRQAWDLQAGCAARPGLPAVGQLQRDHARAVLQ